MDLLKKIDRIVADKESRHQDAYEHQRTLMSQEERRNRVITAYHDIYRVQTFRQKPTQKYCKEFTKRLITFVEVASKEGFDVGQISSTAKIRGDRPLSPREEAELWIHLAMVKDKKTLGVLMQCPDSNRVFARFNQDELLTGLFRIDPAPDRPPGKWDLAVEQFLGWKEEQVAAEEGATYDAFVSQYKKQYRRITARKLCAAVSEYRRKEAARTAAV